ncbi:hypothetical protein ACEN2J_00005, partial [Pseudorhodobacter sp. W20_MBD10_FR17]
MVRPFLCFDVAVDFGVKDEKAGLQCSDFVADRFTMRLKQCAALGPGLRAIIAQSCIAQHFPESYCQIWCLRLVGHAAIWSGVVASIP